MINKKIPWPKIWFVFVVTSPITLPIIWINYQVIGVLFLMLQCPHIELHSTYTSPDKKMKLKVEESNCDVTTPTGANLILTEKGFLKENKDILNLEADPDFVPIKVKWLDSKHLGIRIPSDVEIYHQEKEWQGIHIQVSKDLPPVFTEAKKEALHSKSMQGSAST